MTIYCETCGAEIPGARSNRVYCDACRRERDRDFANICRKRNRRKRLRTISEQERNIRQQEAKYKCKELRYSMRYTFDELIRMANQYGTSYGKFYAWINDHKRLPEEGEKMF